MKYRYTRKEIVHLLARFCSKNKVLVSKDVINSLLSTKETKVDKKYKPITMKTNPDQIRFTTWKIEDQFLDDPKTTLKEVEILRLGEDYWMEKIEQKINEVISTLNQIIKK